MVICFNAFSCIVYMSACPPLLLTRKTSVLLPSVIGQHCVKDSWIDLHNLLSNDSTVTDLYSGCAYFAIVTFMTVGFGDYFAYSFDEV